jgi:hypothetical protein
MNERARAGIGYLPQEASIFRKLNVQDNIKLVLEMNDKLTVDEKSRKLEELLSDTLKYVVKNDIDGLYKISPLIINTIVNESSKYNFILKYLKSYSKIIKYHESVFFNIKKVLDNLESKYGAKLMVEPETKNILSYIILSVQYDLINLSVTMVKYAKKRTLSVGPLTHSIKFLIHEDIYSKIDLKLDSMDDEKAIEVEEEEEEEVIVVDGSESDSDEESA